MEEKTNMPYNQDDIITVNSDDLSVSIDNNIIWGDLDTSITGDGVGCVLTCSSDGNYTWSTTTTDIYVDDMLKEHRVRGSIKHGKTRQKRCYE